MNRYRMFDEQALCALLSWLASASNRNEREASG